MSALPGVVLVIIQLNGDVGRVNTLQCSLMHSSWPMKGEEILSILSSFSLHFMIVQILKDALKLYQPLSGSNNVPCAESSVSFHLGQGWDICCPPFLRRVIHKVEKGFAGDGNLKEDGILPANKPLGGRGVTAWDIRQYSEATFV